MNEYRNNKQTIKAIKERVLWAINSPNHIYSSFGSITNPHAQHMEAKTFLKMLSTREHKLNHAEVKLNHLSHDLSWIDGNPSLICNIALE